jgi:hypothetical protein
MDNKFDELTKNLAQSLTRRGALKKFGAGLGALAVAVLGLARNARAQHGTCGEPCDCSSPPLWGCCPHEKACIRKCASLCTGGA